MAVTTNRSRPPWGQRPDSAALVHLLVSGLFLAIGGALTTLTLLALRFPSFTRALGYGRLRPMALTAIVLGWVVTSLVGGIYYLLPRLTGSKLWREDLANLGGVGLAGVTVAGMVTVGLGFGDGGEPLGLPWWIDLPVLAVLSVPGLVVVQTVRARVEHSTYVSLWYALAGVMWLPLLYLVGNLPNLTAVGRALQGAFFVNGFLNLWVIGVGTGLVYYVLPKVSGQPLWSRQLASVGYWSLLLAAAWGGAARLVHSPLPDWAESVSAVLGLAGGVAAIATVANFALTLQASFAQVRQTPTLHTAWVGAVFYLVLAAAGLTGGFRSAATVTGLTTFWEAISYGTVFGVGGLWVAAWTYQALPNLTGRALFSGRLALRHVRLTVAGVGGTVLLLVLHGLVSGYAWAGGAFTGAFEAVGNGFTDASRGGNVLLGLTALTGLTAFGGQLAFLTNLFRTITSGRPTVAEVLVPAGAAHE